MTLRSCLLALVLSEDEPRVTEISRRPQRYVPLHCYPIVSQLAVALIPHLEHKSLAASRGAAARASSERHGISSIAGSPF